jgi:hypothetical protein
MNSVHFNQHSRSHSGIYVLVVTVDVVFHIPCSEEEVLDVMNRVISVFDNLRKKFCVSLASFCSILVVICRFCCYCGKLRTRAVDAAAIAVANLYLKPCYQVF